MPVFDLQAQNGKTFRFEVQIENDNDAYTLNLFRDQYYSNGAYVRFRHFTDSTRWGRNIKKVIRTYHINHRIFSPKHLSWSDSSDFDRPYAGQMSLSISNEYYFERESYLNLKLELGWMGPSLRIGQLQYEWHKAFGMTLPKGWHYQIEDSPIINLWGTYANNLWGTKGIDLTSETNLAAGTAFSHVRQEFVIRLGNMAKPLFESTQYNSLLGTVNHKRGVKEAYFFISPGIEFVPYNSTIEGGFIGKQSPHVEEPIRWIYQTRAGILISWTQFDLGLVYYRRTKETTEATWHKYVGIRLNQRF